MGSEIRIYYEGDVLLKSGFDAFFRELRRLASEKGCDLRLIAAGSGSAARRDFGKALRTHRGAWNILLIDSEGPLGKNPSASLCQAEGWKKTHSDSIFWMVEMMEAWFHADKDALARFYGPSFKKAALKANSDVEQIPKKDLERGLHRATKNCLNGGYYANKATHGRLALINPALVRKSASNCRRLFEAIMARLA